MIYIIRHGQTAWNLKKRKQGRKDSPLTLIGIEQAKKTATTLQNEIPNIDDFKIVISPQWRCQQYASIICELLGLDFLDCIHEEELREHSFGLWEGKNEEEIEEEFPGFLSRRYQPKNYWTYVVPMGESYELLMGRVLKVLDKYREEDVIFICHEMVSKVMRGHLLQLKEEEILPLKHKQNIVYSFHQGQLKTIEHI